MNTNDENVGDFRRVGINLELAGHGDDPEHERHDNHHGDDPANQRVHRL